MLSTAKAKSVFEGVGVSDVIIAGVGAAIIIAIAVLWAQVQDKQDRLAIVNYRQLSDLYTGEVVGTVRSAEELEALTDQYLVAAREIVRDYASRTGTVVIMEEAVIGGSERLPDLTRAVHDRAMESLVVREAEEARG